MKPTFVLVVACLLSACTINVTPQSVLVHDEQHPAIDIGALQAGLRERLEPVSLRHVDDTVSHGVHLVNPRAKAVIVYLPGNKMRLAAYGPSLLPRFAMLDADVYWLDYRGLGASEGLPGLQSLQDDVADLLTLAARSKKPIIVHGLSMGSLLAGRIANDPRVAALVLEGGVPTIAVTADATIPTTMRTFVDVKVASELAAFDNLSVLAKYEKPLLLLVGDRDDETPPALSMRLYDATRTTTKRLAVAQNKTHLDAMTADESIVAYKQLIAAGLHPPQQNARRPD